MTPGSSIFDRTDRPTSDDGASLLVKPLAAEITAEYAFARFRSLPYCVWLDSAAADPDRGRFSYLTADPIDVVRVPHAIRNSLAGLKRFAWIANYPAVERLPPFQGGLVGTLAYDLCDAFEAIPAHRFNDLPVSAVCVGCFDWCLAFDHVQNRGWLISQGWTPEGKRTHQRAIQRLEQVQDWLQAPPAASNDDPQQASSTQYEVAAPGAEGRAELSSPLYLTASAGVMSNFSPRQFRQAVASIVEGIRRGDAFQVNLAQRLIAAQRRPAADVYLDLRRSNPAPYAGYFDAGDWQLLSSSPEQFLELRGRQVRTRPIKGTRARQADLAEDLRSAEQLRHSSKDIAENVMIVDLLRNDLSRVCQDDSVRVARLCEIESFAHVHHLVSEVEGTLRDECGLVDLLEVAFPGGSITGAPKVQAMRTIAMLEPTQRGLYCGSLGYFSTAGASDWNILIRSIIAARGWMHASVGGGITAQSDPERELQETWAKARGIIDLLTSSRRMTTA
jgi:para-aminobenzoate synthetase component 1